MEQSQDQVQSGINLMADIIDGYVEEEAVDGGPVSETFAEKEAPEPEPAETTEAPEPEPEPEPPPKKKLKWQGQEVDVDETELISLAQQGYDYTKKTQELADKMRELAPLEGISKHIKEDPRFAAHIAQYWQKPQPEPEKQTFDDPIQELEHRISEKVKKDHEAALQQQLAPIIYKQLVNETRAEAMRDPHYDAIMGEMKRHLDMLPGPTAQVVYRQWDTDPQAYMEAFKHFRAKVADKKEPPPSSEPPPPAQGKRTVKAPIIEASGSVPPATDVAERKARLSKDKAKALRSGDPQALADWLMKSGAIDDLF